MKQLSVALTLFSMIFNGGCKKEAQGPGAMVQSAPNAATLDVNLIPQKMDNWCWAASAKMVLLYLGQQVPQCSQANDRFGYSNCCITVTPKACNQPGWPEFEKHALSYKRTSSAAISLKELKDQIALKKNPIAFAWKWTGGGGGHMMVAVGYASVDAEDFIEVNNPWEPNIGSRQRMTYDEFVSAVDHTHWDDFYDF